MATIDQKSVTPEFSVSPQTTAADIDAVAKAGFCNRPDGEGEDQTAF
jgi:uncharacterized protein (TIGR01244 family)